MSVWWPGHRAGHRGTPQLRTHGAETIHAARALRSALHGFVSLEIAGGFGFDVDIDRSFHRLIERLVDSFGQTADTESRGINALS